MRHVRHRKRTCGRRAPLVGFLLATVLAGTMGLECDDNAVTTFRQTAAGDIGTGIKTILDAVVDGVVAAVEQAGDGSSSSSSSSSTST